MDYGLVLLMALGMTLWFVSGGEGQAMAEQQEQQSTYDSKGKRDPFVPLVRDGRLVGVASDTSSPMRFSTPQLVGIVWDPKGHSLALINDTEVKVGDTIGDYRVAEIHPDAVVLVRDGEPLVLQITFEETQPPKKPQDSRGGEQP